ncbi:3-oxoacyl-ACP synthase [Streptomyces griseocarneus]|nr:3-oxoacyl-ACP synthase [Streptomyces griseocarneus]
MEERLYCRVAAVAAHLPEARMSTEELEDSIAELSPGFSVPRGAIQRLTGVGHRHIRPEGWYASDLAAAAARQALAEAGRTIAEMDLLIYAGVCIDVLEPATAHIVADKLGADCPVFDVRNACNSFLNALELGDSLIRSGSHRRILICCGEISTQVMRRRVSSMREFVDSMMGYTVSDAGAAAVLEPSAEPGILACRFSAASSAWQAASVTLDGHFGTVDRRRPPDLSGMVKALHALGGQGVAEELSRSTGFTADDVSLFCVQFAAAQLVDDFRSVTGTPASRLMTTIATHGNTAAATLPLQLDLAQKQGRLHRGDLAVLVGFASGVSEGIVGIRW